MKLLNDKAVAKSQLQKKLGQLLYLTNLEKVRFTVLALYQTKLMSCISLAEETCHYFHLKLSLQKMCFLESASVCVKNVCYSPHYCIVTVITLYILAICLII